MQDIYNLFNDNEKKLKNCLAKKENYIFIDKI